MRFVRRHAKEHSLPNSESASYTHSQLKTCGFLTAETQRVAQCPVATSLPLPLGLLIPCGMHSGFLGSQPWSQL